MIKVDSQKCIQCGRCIDDCIVEVLKFDNNRIPYIPKELETFCLNCQHCLAICPEGALSCHGVSPEECAPIGELPTPENMLNLIRQRRSIRSYYDENLSAETIDRLKDALAWTPTGCNAHNLNFIIIEDKVEMEFFRQEMAKMLRFLIKSGIMHLIYPNFKRYLKEILAGKDVVFRNAPHMIIATVPKSAPCAESDPQIALSYFDLYAQSLGVGSCWCGFAVHAFRWNRALRKRLQIPPKHKIGAVMLFGKPKVEYARATAPAQFPVF